MNLASGNKPFGLIHLILAVVGTGLAVLLASRTVLSDRVSVEGENEFRKGVERRLLRLEQEDVSLKANLDAHIKEDDVVKGKLDDRVRDVEIALARMAGPVKPTWRRKIIYRPDTDGIIVRLAPSYEKRDSP